jgi:hypothetical protein
MLFMYHDNYAVLVLLMYRSGASGATARRAAGNQLMRLFGA